VAEKASRQRGSGAIGGPKGDGDRKAATVGRKRQSAFIQDKKSAGNQPTFYIIIRNPSGQCEMCKKEVFLLRTIERCDLLRKIL